MKTFRMLDAETTHDGKVLSCFVSDEYGNIELYNNVGGFGIYNRLDNGFIQIPKDGMDYIGGVK